MKLKKILGVGILATSLFFAGCLDEDVADNETTLASATVPTVTGQFPQFSASNLNGENVTDEIFEQKKITVVNIWGTFCGPCIGEMPELGEWAKNMPENAQLIGIVCDIQGDGDYSTIAEANNILSSANANFVNIIPDKSILKYLQTVEAVPTTFFIDSFGNIIGEPVIGADVDSYKERVEEYLK